MKCSTLRITNENGSKSYNAYTTYCVEDEAPDNSYFPVNGQYFIFHHGELVSIGRIQRVQSFINLPVSKYAENGCNCQDYRIDDVLCSDCLRIFKLTSIGLCGNCDRAMTLNTQLKLTGKARHPFCKKCRKKMNAQRKRLLNKGHTSIEDSFCDECKIKCSERRLGEI